MQINCESTPPSPSPPRASFLQYACSLIRLPSPRSCRRASEGFQGFQVHISRSRCCCCARPAGLCPLVAPPAQAPSPPPTPTLPPDSPRAAQAQAPIRNGRSNDQRRATRVKSLLRPARLRSRRSCVCGRRVLCSQNEVQVPTPPRLLGGRSFPRG